MAELSRRKRLAGNSATSHGKERQKILRKERSSTSLNVKDPEAHRLARAIAEATGVTMTRAVTEALRERYERLQNQRGKASVAELLAIAQRVSALVKKPYLDHAEFLYDESGLPK